MYIYIYIIQGVWLASLAHSLLMHRFHLCIYCMEGYCVHGTSVPVCSMNNKQWFKGQVYSKLQASLCCTVHNLDLVIWRHSRPSTYFRHYLNQPAQKLVNCRAFSYLQRRQRRGHGENLLPALRFYVQERHPDRATSPATYVTGKPSWRSHPPPALRAESVV